MTIERDLIQRLADALHDAAEDVEGWGNYASIYFQEKHDLSGNIAKIHAQVKEARAFLAQSEPEGPTDRELVAVLKQAIKDFPPNHPDAKALDSLEYDIEIELRKARAVLARWGK